MSPITNKKIVVLGTGGTIAGKSRSAGDNVGYTAAQVGVGELLAAVPALASARFALVAEQVAQIDSKDMGFSVWRQLATRCAHWLAQPDVQGIVITHGTDTLEETAFFLHCVLDAAKPVVLTCAMRPSTAIAPDGPQNLLDAVALASDPLAHGVMVVCAGTIHAAPDVQKVHTYRLDAFGSGDAGPLGYVEEGALRQLRPWPRGGSWMHARWADAVVWPRVDIVMSYAGADGTLVETLLARGMQGLVLAATGNGSLHHDLRDAALKAQAAGVKVVRSTRCPNGRVLPGADNAIADSQGLSPVKARIALMLELMG